LSHKITDRQTYLLPAASGVGLAGSVDGVLELAEVDKGGSKAGKVRDVGVQDLGGLEHLEVIEGFIRISWYTVKTKHTRDIHKNETWF
jgi:hypothetical protein